MENREALKNAGLEENINRQLVIKKENINIFIRPENLHTEVYVDGITLPLKIKKLNDLEDVKAFCYGYLGYFLDFTEKPKYDWETVKSGLPPSKVETLDRSLYYLNLLSTTGVIDHLEAFSMIAKLKLNIIIQQIDKDYPKEEEGFWGCIHLSHRGRGNPVEMKAYETTDPKEWSMITECVQGAKILLDQNPQLLQNLFKIETDATE